MCLAAHTSNSLWNNSHCCSRVVFFGTNCTEISDLNVAQRIGFCFLLFRRSSIQYIFFTISADVGVIRTDLQRRHFSRLITFVIKKCTRFYRLNMYTVHLCLPDVNERGRLLRFKIFADNLININDRDKNLSSGLRCQCPGDCHSQKYKSNIISANETWVPTSRDGFLRSRMNRTPPTRLRAGRVSVFFFTGHLRRINGFLSVIIEWTYYFHTKSGRLRFSTRSSGEINRVLNYDSTFSH